MRFRLHAANLPFHLGEVFKADLYLPFLKEKAGEVLAAHNLSESAVQSLVDTITGESEERRMRFTMHAPAGSGGQGGITLVEWITQHKHLSQERDFYHKDSPLGKWVAGQVHPPEVIESQIARAAFREGNLLPPADHPELIPLPDSFTRTDMPGHGALNPDGLLAMVGPTGMSAEALHQAFADVLAAWAVRLRKELTAATLRAIRIAFDE